MRLPALLALPLLASANQVDVLFPHYIVDEKCAAGCAAWSSADDKLWAEGVAPKDAGSTCAIPGAVVDKAIGGPETASAGPFCYCA
jgi:hypothetical protein